MSVNGTCENLPSLKILMTADAVGGVWQYSLDLIAFLVDRGVEVLLATMGRRPTPEQEQALANLKGVTLHQSDYKLEWMKDPWADVDKSGEWLLDLARQFQPSLVHLNGYAHATLPWNAPTVVVAHSCVYSWWQAVHGSAPPAADWAEYRERVRAGLHAADQVIAPSGFMRDALTANYALPPERVRVIHNFSSSPVYNGSAKQQFFLAAGRTWDIGKNLSIVERISDRLPWPSQIAGSLPHETVLGQMQRASIYVHPALYEPFGLAVLEAARAQCCLVLADIPPLRELWDGAALFVDPRDEDAWACSLTRLADNQLSCESLAHLARLRANRYAASNAVDGYWRTYRALQSRSQKGAAA